MTTFRIATFNVENMFERPKAMNLETWEEGRPALDAYAQLNLLINKESYSSADKKDIIKLLKGTGLDKTNEGAYLILQEIRGDFIKRSKGRPAEIVASGRSDWVGWIELKRAPVREVTTENTARVFKEVEADIIGVIETENRIALQHFNNQLIPFVGGTKYDHVMLVDGNDDRGIDVGLMTRTGFEIASIRSHVDDVDASGRRIFSRDCPEYMIPLPGGESILVLVNHLKSKGYGKPKDNDARRKAQAGRVREIYDSRRQEGQDLIAIVGDFNDIPANDPLSPLLRLGSDLRDISEHSKFETDGFPGTWKNGTKSQKLDYILLSPALFAAVQKAAVMRKGVWGGKNGTRWEHFPTMKSAKDAASDHAALWVDLDV